MYESSPVSAVKTWKSPVLLIHADDDRNVEFHQTVDLETAAAREAACTVEELVIPDDIHDFLLWRTWKTVTTADRCVFRTAVSAQGAFTMTGIRDSGFGIWDSGLGIRLGFGFQDLGFGVRT